MGSLSPSFPAARSQAAETADKGNVRMGSLSPAFPTVRIAPANTTDGGKVRMGSLSPALQTGQNAKRPTASGQSSALMRRIVFRPDCCGHMPDLTLRVTPRWIRLGPIRRW